MLVHDVVKDKFCYRLGDSNIFLACHKAKVSGLYCAKQVIRSRGRDHCCINPFNAQLTLKRTRQMMEAVTIGMLDVRGELSNGDVEALAKWVIRERVDMVVTSWFR